MILKEEKVFAARRLMTKSNGGLWEFPGGKIEPGEKPEAALEREIFEEFGIHPKVHSLFSHTEYHQENGIIELMIYRCSWSEDPKHGTDHDKWGYYSPEELLSMDLSPADEPAAQKMVQIIRERRPKSPLSQ